METTDDFIAKSLRSLQNQIIGVEKTITYLENRIRMLEDPPNHDEIISKDAAGRIVIYQIRDKDGNWIDPRRENSDAD